MASPDVDIAVGYEIMITGGSSNSTWSAAVRIFDVVPPGEEVEDILTSYQGMLGTTHTYRPADIKEGGELTLIIYHQEDVRPVIGFVESNGNDLEECVLTYPDGETATFDCYVKSYTPESHSFNDRMMSTVVIKVSGDVT